MGGRVALQIHVCARDNLFRVSGAYNVVASGKTWLLYFVSRYGRLAQSETEAHVTNGVLQADSLSVADHELDHRLLVILITIAVSTSRYV